MKPKFSLLILIFVFCLAASGLAQSAPDSQSDQGVKSDVKQAGRSTANASKKTARKTKNTSKKVAHKGARKTRQGSEKVEQKTQTPPQ